jgi:outer membrane protein OmpA-like peptidoglycan-associated protein
MKILIDSETLKLTGLTPTEYYILANLINGVVTYDFYETLVKKGYLIRETPTSKPILTEKSWILFDKSPETEFSKFVEKYRDIFNVKFGAIGDDTLCNNRMIKFFHKYSEFSDKELILNATKLYVAEQSKSNYKYLIQADNFILKNDNGVEVSKLATYCKQCKKSSFNVSGNTDELGTINV